MKRVFSFGALVIVSTCSVFLTNPASASTPLRSVSSPTSNVSSSLTSNVSFSDSPYDEQALIEATENNIFAGYSFDDAAKTVSVYSTSAASDADKDQIRRITLPAGYVLNFPSATFSWAQLEKLQTSLPNVLGATLAASLAEVIITPESNGLALTFTSVSAPAEVAVRNALGRVPFTLDQGSAFKSGAAGQTRTNEGTGPWHGGGRIALTGSSGQFTSGCTAGFVLRISGTLYDSTAGHCGAGGGNSVVEAASGHFIGSVVHRSYNDSGNWDTEYYDVTSSFFSTAIWVSDSSGQQVKGANSPRSGATVCLSGSYHGTNCGGSTRASGVCAAVSGVYTCHMGSFGVFGPGEGDSGGPVYAGGNGGVLAVGTYVGGNSQGNQVYTTISEVLSHWGASIATG